MLSVRLYLRIVKRLISQPLKCFVVIVSIFKINITLRRSAVKVIFYDRFAMHSSFSRPVLDEFLRLGGNALCLVGDKSHPGLSNGKGEGKVFYIDPRYELFFRYLNIPLIVTPATCFDLGPNNKFMKIAHIFHSPVSMHYVYRDGSFDGYDIFFAVGSHHSKEFELLSSLRGWKNKSCYPAGYPKIDALATDCLRASVPMTKGKKGRVAFAPSWGEKNILRSHGLTIIKDLLAEGFEVVLRPHKHSFDFDQDVIDDIRKSFQGMDFKIDEAIGFDQIYSCDVLVSDWSGVAYEFAFSTGRPVVSVDVDGGQKIQSVRNVEINIKPMEEVCRFEIGVVAGPDEVCKSVSAIFDEGISKWPDDIVKARKKYLYNFGSSAAVIASYITAIVSKELPLVGK